MIKLREISGAVQDDRWDDLQKLINTPPMLLRLPFHFHSRPSDPSSDIPRSLIFQVLFWWEIPPKKWELKTSLPCLSPI